MKNLKFSKTETQLFLDKFLSEDEFHGFSQSVVNAYSAVDGVYKATPALGAFGNIGFDLRPHLLRIFVEHSLQKYADTHNEFTHEIRLNIAKNCSHLRVYKNGLALTSHYMGANSDRPAARKALHKINLTERNRDLFEFENNHRDAFENVAYAQIMHGGIIRPTNILINIPSKDQYGTLGSIPLSIPTENKTQVEEIIDETPFKLKEAIEEYTSGNQKKTS